MEGSEQRKRKRVKPNRGGADQQEEPLAKPASGEADYLLGFPLSSALSVVMFELKLLLLGVCMFVSAGVRSVPSSPHALSHREQPRVVCPHTSMHLVCRVWCVVRCHVSRASSRSVLEFNKHSVPRGFLCFSTVIISIFS